MNARPQVFRAKPLFEYGYLKLAACVGDNRVSIFEFRSEDSDLGPRTSDFLLCFVSSVLGNELLADDAFGLVAAEELRRRFPQMDVVFTTDSGFHLIDYLDGIELLVVVDSIQTGSVPPEPFTYCEVQTSSPPTGPHPTISDCLRPSSWPRNCSLMSRRMS